MIDWRLGEADPAFQDASERMGEVILVKVPTPSVDQVNPLPQVSPAVPIARILPPIDTVLENEIWQYRYPPFDNLFATNPAEDDAASAESESSSSGRSARFNTDSLPSYVIGILDPAELVDGLFQQRPFGPFRSGDVLSNRNSDVESNEFNDGFNNNQRSSKTLTSAALQEPSKKVFAIPRIILESDDRWIWRN